MSTPIYDHNGIITGYKTKSYPSGEAIVVRGKRDTDAANQAEREATYAAIAAARRRNK